jgi:ubiquitin
MKQINVSEFLKLNIAEQIAYTSVLEHLKSKELLSVKISELTYNEVKQIFKQLSKPNCDIEFVFTTALKIIKEDFFMLPIQNYFQIKKYIETFFVSLKQNEITLLQSIDANIGLWEIAGGNELNEFADVLPLSQLAKIYGGYPFEYGEKNYIEIIYLLRMNNKQSQVENEYQKLIANESKNKTR